MMCDVVKYIEELKVEILEEPQCALVFMLLALEFKEAEAYYDNDHIITKIGDKFYDWKGEYNSPNLSSFLPFSNYGVDWSKEHYRTIVESLQ